MLVFVCVYLLCVLCVYVLVHVKNCLDMNARVDLSKTCVAPYKSNCSLMSHCWSQHMQLMATTETV